MTTNTLPLNELRDGAEIAVTVAAAVDSGLLEALADEPGPTNAVADRLGLDRRAVGIVVEALRDLGILVLDGSAYRLADDWRTRLGDPSAPDYAGGGLPHWLRTLRNWTRLPDVLRAGGPVPEGSDPSAEGSREDVHAFLAAMAAAPAERVERTVRRCLDRRPGARTMLDLGGGPGHYARAFARAGVRATLFDRPDVIAVVRESFAPDAEGVELVAGDFLADGVPSGPFDIVLGNNITHIYSGEQNAALIGGMAGALAPGGLLALGDFVRGRSPRAARFAILMLLHTDGGDTYSEDTYRRWLADAGLRDVRVEDIDVDRQLVTAVKP